MPTTRRAGPLAYVEAGDGPPLLLVHGFPLDGRMWREQLAGLSDGCRVLAPDLRGFGGSQPLESAEPLRMSQLADDLAELLDALGIDQPAAVCGLSMGGYVALSFWRRHRHRLRALALCDSRAAADPPAARQTREESAETALASGVDALCEAMLPKLLAAETIERAPQLAEEMAAMMRSTPPATFAAAQRGMAVRDDMTPHLPQLDVPCLLLCGSEDGITPPAEMRSLAEAMPSGEFMEIAGAGHLPPLERPEAVNAALRDWLGKLPR